MGIISRCHFKSLFRVVRCDRVVNFVYQVPLLKIERGLGLRSRVISIKKMLCIIPIACMSSF